MVSALTGAGAVIFGVGDFPISGLILIGLAAFVLALAALAIGVWLVDRLLPQKPGAAGQIPTAAGSGNLAPNFRPIQEIDAKIAAAEARGDTKIARMEGKMDLVLSTLDSIGTRFEDARADARNIKAEMLTATNNARTDMLAASSSAKANAWVVGIGLAALIVALVVAVPAFYDLGGKQRDAIHEEVKRQVETQKPTGKP